MAGFRMIRYEVAQSVAPVVSGRCRLLAEYGLDGAEMVAAIKKALADK